MALEPSEHVNGRVWPPGRSHGMLQTIPENAQ